jgi:endonuclease YncB( thermonuclease family)
VVSPPPSQPPSRWRAFWNTRSWKGKAGLIAAAIIVFLIAIGIAFPAEDDKSSDSVPTETTGAATTPTSTGSETTTPETTTEAAPIFVTRVVDGDTINVDSGDRIRLVQIDSPEDKGECYGKKSGTVLRQVLPVGTEVRLVRDPKLDGVDQYGRLLRYVFVGQKNVNLAVVQKGSASV